MPNLYKLENDARPGELGGPPLIIGSALRFPSTAYDAWGISGNRRVLYELSLSTYQDEFAETSPSWMESVVEAAERGGIGNRPQMLRDGGAKAAAALTYNMLKNDSDTGYVKVLDVGCGAGGSLTAYLKELKEIEPSYLERVILTGVDLSRGSLWKCMDVMEDEEFATGGGFSPVHSRDIDMTTHLQSGSQDIVINVAGIHANAYLDVSMGAISYVLRTNGYLVSGDWHHARWLHPCHTYGLLDEMDPEHFEWTNKGEFMDEFLETFPRAIERPDMSGMTPEDLAAIDEIGKYWRDGWAEVRLEKIREGVLKPTDEQIMSEGHRPVEQYIEEGRRKNLLLDEGVSADGILPSNPYSVVEGTSLNQVLVLRKTL